MWNRSTSWTPTTSVIATDGYTHGLLPRLDEVIVPVRGQVIATEPLSHRLFDCPHYSRHGFDYWQQTDDDRLILGGRRDTQADHEFTAEEAIAEPIQRELETFAAELIGKPPKMGHRWAGIFGQTLDLMPLAGQIPGHNGVWVAAGYSGHGNVLWLHLCGELVAQAILGRPARRARALRSRAAALGACRLAGLHSSQNRRVLVVLPEREPVALRVA